MHLLIPMAAVDEPACRAAWRALRLPHLSQLAARLQAQPVERLADDDPATPEEFIRARAIGWPARAPAPWAALRAHELALEQPDSAAWAFVTPCHWLLGQNQVTLSDPQELALSESESRALLAAMQPYFAQDGITLVYDSAARWLARGEVFGELQSASPARVVGHDIKPWLPGAALLRRLQTEMQMLLYSHPVNEARSARGLTPVNAFWISGCGALSATGPKASAAPSVAHELLAPAWRGDWAAWARAWQAIDAGPGAALWAALRRGDPQIRLTLCGERSAQTWHNAPQGLLQRLAGGLRRPSLDSLLESL